MPLELKNFKFVNYLCFYILIKTSMENDEDSGSGLEDGIGIDDQRTEQIKNILDNHIVG